MHVDVDGAELQRSTPTGASATGNRPGRSDPVVPETGGPRGVPGADEEPDAPAETDGRRLRRALNREAVVDALLDLYREGNLRPGTDLIAERAGLSPRSLFRYFEDTDDLAGEAALRQQIRALPLVVLEVDTDDAFDERVRVLVEQRFRLFGEIGNAAMASRLRAPFHPRMADTLGGTRAFLRGQVRTLFSHELDAMDGARAEAVLAAADLLTTFESYQLLTGAQGLDTQQASSLLVGALTVLLSPGAPAGSSGNSPDAPPVH